MTEKKIYAIGACRTAIGAFGGSLKDMPAPALGAAVLKEAIARAGITHGDIDEVIMGCVLQAGLGQNVARQAAMQAGIPVEVPAQTINKVCGSGLCAVILAAQSILCGDSACAAAGGAENMSAAPYISKSHRWGARMGEDKLTDSMVTEGLWDVFNDYHMGITAENVAKKYGVTRAEQDEFSYRSHMKAAAAIASGAFKDEIVPITIPQRKGDAVVFDTDEFVRPDTTAEKLARLKPAFKPDGTVTAGNSSGINDGAAAFILAGEDFIQKRNLKPLFRIVSWGSRGVDPAYMGMGPVPSIQLALSKAGLDLAKIQAAELNEAFASQAIAVVKMLGIDPGIVNVHGGAIALGHPIGASGARILATLCSRMAKEGLRYGVASLCIGGGMGEAVVIERDERCE
jgi:acetyl-CoA C-acetyltransferase